MEIKQGDMVQLRGKVVRVAPDGSRVHVQLEDGQSVGVACELCAVDAEPGVKALDGPPQDKALRRAGRK